MLKRCLKGLVYMVGLVLLASCAMMRPQLHTMPWPERQAQLLGLTAWQFSGAVSFYDGRRSTLANISWQQSARYHYRITLSGPLGLGATRIVGQPGSVVLWRSATVKMQAKTPEALMQQALGWQLPLTNMVYWVRGLNAPGSPVQTTFEQHNLLKTLVQQGWHIHYLRFGSFDGVDLPTEITFSNRHIVVKLVISHWRVNLEPGSSVVK